jgi:hypothetical protein
MSITDKIDREIERLISSLVEEHGRSGFLSTASDERKAEIIKHIAKLRASMSPQCNCKKD